MASNISSPPHFPFPSHIWLIAGYAGSGKDTVANFLAELLGSDQVKRDSFAGAVKDEVAAMYEFNRGYLDTADGKARMVQLCDGTRRTVRELLIEHAETTKTKTGDPAIWAKRIAAPNATHWILSDWRFLDELLNLRMRFPKAAIHTLRVRRSSVTPMASHTEHELDDAATEFTIDNDGSLVYIVNQLQKIVDRL